MLQREAADLATFHRALREIARTANVHHSTMKLWFRGQARRSWPLLPGLYRNTAVVPARYERELTRDFRTKSPPFLAAAAGAEREMFLMQHYGLPTRLLDWTTNSLVALYFAVEHASDEPSCVWVLSPWKLNEVTLKRPTVPTAANAVFRHYMLLKYDQTTPAGKTPLAITSVHHDDRIRAQDSTFTIHGSERVALEQVRTPAGESPLIAQISVPRSERGAMKRELYDVGIHRGRLFPDLTGVAVEIAYRYSTDFFVPDETVSFPVRFETAETAAATTAMPPRSVFENVLQQPSPPSPDSHRATASTDTSDVEAKRVARDLVLQIKQRNSVEIEAGKRGGDLHYRLRTEIERARREFENVVGDVLGERSAYFDEQLVLLLAEGDRTLLKL